ncbi:DUF2339 domain-containing protein [[Brevibacterium] frigoritolerans]|nr:DUF2339 domain-containing protein [Peribacillus frigoritolerans]
MEDRSSELRKKIQKIEEDLNIVKLELDQITNRKQMKKVTVSEKVKERAKDSTEASKQTKGMDQLVGEWLPRVFIFVFILGIIWSFIAASQNGWINPVVRVILGFVLSGFLLWLGHKQYKKSATSLGIVLIGGSVVIYIASIFAGNVLYHIIPYFLTLILLAVGLYVGTLLSRKYNSESLLVIIGVGAYLYPFLFAGKTENEHIFYTYETLVFIGLAVESMRKQYKVSWNISVYAFLFTLFIFLLYGDSSVTLLTLLVMVVQQLVVILMSVRANNPINNGMYVTAITTGAFFMYFLAENLFFNITGQFILFLLTMTLAYGLLSTYKKFSKEFKNIYFIFSMFYLFLTITKFFTDSNISTIVVMLQVIGVYYISQKRESVLGTLGSLVIILPVIGYLIDVPGKSLTILSQLNWILLIGFFLAVYIFKEKNRVIPKDVVEKTSPYIIGGLLLIWISKISEYFTDKQDYMFNNIGLSVSWIVFVGIMYAFYSYFKNVHWKYIGLSFLIITLVKITLVDLIEVNLVWRAILFIAIGVVGLLISRIFYNKKEK